MERAPDRDFCHRALAMVSSHDAWGRPMRPGMDRVTALAAARRAAELEPRQPAHHLLAGQLLERDENGVLLGQGSDPVGAIASYAAALDVGDDLAPVDRILDLVARSGDWDRLDAVADTISHEAGVRKLRTLRAAVADGPEAAYRAARRGSGDAQARGLLAELAAVTIATRHYGLAVGLFERALEGEQRNREIAQYLRMVAGLRRSEELELDLDGPSGPVIRLFLAMGSGSPDSFVAQLADHVDPLALEGYREEGQSDLGAVRRLLADSIVQLENDPLLSRVGADAMLSDFQTRVDDDGAGGYRVRYQLRWGSEGPRENTVFVVEREGIFRVLCEPTEPGLMGLRALELLDAGAVEAARTWIEWLPVVPDARPDEILLRSPLARGLEIADLQRPDDLRRIAAASLAFPGELKQTRSILEGQLMTCEDPAWRSVLLHAAAIGYSDRLEADELAQLYGELHALHPESAMIRDTLGQALAARGDTEGVRRLAEDEDWGTAAERTRVRASLLAALGDIDATVDALIELVESGDAELEDYNALAWYELYRGRADEEILDHALEALVGGVAGRGASLHTLACVYAERGQLTEAFEAWREGQQVEQLREPNDSWRYVIARIAEQVGETGFARRIYEDLENELPHAAYHASVRAFADQRLEALDALESLDAGGADTERR